MPGTFIVFEGGEGAGKTTQIQALYNGLQSHPLVHELRDKSLISGIMMTREPGGSHLGKAIRHLLLNHVPQSDDDGIAPETELLLYAADRAQHVQQCLIPNLAKNVLILCDRYVDSTVAYQGYGRGLDHDIIRTLNQIATGGLQSDLTLWLDIDVEAGLARTRQRGLVDRMEKNDRPFHENVRRGFQTLAQEHPQRIVRIDADRDMHAIANEIQSVVIQKLMQWYGM